MVEASTLSKNEKVRISNCDLDDNTCVKAVPYILNNKSLCKKLLKNLYSRFSPETDIKKKDRGKQFTVDVNTATYVIMMNNIINIGEGSGIKIVKRDPIVDGKGQHVKDQFDVVITNQRIEVPITITCLHTTSKIWIQLLGKPTDGEWEGKKAVLGRF